MGTAEKQKQIQGALDALGWSHRQLADVLYEELYASESDDFEDTDKEEIQKLAQNIKKQLQRSSTPEKRLDRYLRVLCEHPDYQALKLGTVLTKYVEHSCLDNDLANHLAQLSAKLDKVSGH